MKKDANKELRDAVRSGEVTAWRNDKQKEDLLAGREPRIYDHNIDKNGDKMAGISVRVKEKVAS